MSVGSLSLQFAPLLPWAILAAAALAGLILLGFSFWRRARGGLWRLLALVALLGALANPSVVQEDRNYLSDVAVVVVDDSESQTVPPRQAQTAWALAELQKRIKEIPGLELRVVHAGNDPASEASDGGGTRLFGALARGIADLPASRIAGAVIISDGQIHDVPTDLDALGFHAPVHLLLTGLPDEADRRLVVVASPSFGLVDKPVTFRLRVEDAAAPPGSQATLSILKDGKPLAPVIMPIGQDMSVDLDIDHGGQNIFEFSVEPGAKELSLANNSAVVLVNGVRDRLRVLLISGEPHAGERAWRALLKSDPSVDLVHFTILRPPEKQDATPINELSLIAFPVRDLFELKLKEFDLVIFDRYRREGVSAARLFREHRPLCAAGRRSAGFGGARLCHALQPLSLALGRRAAGRAHRPGTGATLPAATDSAGPPPSRNLGSRRCRFARSSRDMGPLVSPDRGRAPSRGERAERRRSQAAAGPEPGRQGPHGRIAERPDLAVVARL